MNAFQYFCVVVISAALVLMLLWKLHEWYHEECAQCRAEEHLCGLDEKPIANVEGEEEYSSSDEEDSDSDSDSDDDDDE